MHDPAGTSHIAIGDACQYSFETSEKPVFLRMPGFHQNGRQCRRQGERHDSREHHGDGDGYRKLLVKLPGHAAEEGHRDKHRVQYQHDRDQRA